jgi:hypothetical protein
MVPLMQLKPLKRVSSYLPPAKDYGSGRYKRGKYTHRYVGEPAAGLTLANLSLAA